MADFEGSFGGIYDVNDIYQRSPWYRTEQDYGYGSEPYGPDSYRDIEPYSQEAGDLSNRRAEGIMRGKRYRGIGPRTYKRPDHLIQEDISERLAENDLVDARDINVQVENGIVTLTGSVYDKPMKRLADEIAEETFGVKLVRNHLQVTYLNNPPSA